MLELAQLHVRRFLGAPARRRQLNAVPLLLDADVGGQRSGQRLLRVGCTATRRGRLNLHKFDAALQAQLESYLVTLGILQPGQTLTAQEAPPEPDMASPQPVYEN